MSWLYVGDEFYDDPKVAELGGHRARLMGDRPGLTAEEADGQFENACIGVWTKAGTWSKKKRTNGFVPRGLLRNFGGLIENAIALCDVGLWAPVEGGFQFVNWERWQKPDNEDQQVEKRVHWKLQKRDQRARDRAQKRATQPEADCNAGADETEPVEPDEKDVSVGQPADALRTEGGSPRGQSAVSAPGPRRVPRDPSPSPSPSPPDPSDPSPTPTPSAREVVRAGLPANANFEQRIPFVAAVERMFRRLCRDANRPDPATGGKNVDKFPVRLANTARDRGETCDVLMDRAFAAWKADDFDGCERATPYSAFVARFDRYVLAGTEGHVNGQVKQGFVSTKHAGTAEEHARGTDGTKFWGVGS